MRLRRATAVLIATWAIATVSSCRSEAPTAILRDGRAATIDCSRAPLTLLHFWGSWCVPCRAELPELVATAPRLHGEGVQLIAIAEDERWSDVEAFLRQHRAVAATTFTPILDPQRALAARYDVRTFPTTLVLSRSGSVIERFDGPVEWSSRALHARLRELAATSR